MRGVFSGALAAGLLVSRLGFAVECPRVADNPAFDVEGLKTELMYIALTCDSRDRYNAFINRYRSELNDDEKVLNTHFTRSYGRTGTKQHDDFVTNLANSESQGGLKQGSNYCMHNTQVFDEVMALHNARELEEYAAGRASPPPALVHACAGSAATAASTPTRHTTTRRRS